MATSQLDPLSTAIIGCAIEVHRNLGPGLLESTYERCLVRELTLNNIQAERQKTQPIHYKGLKMEEGYRIDILVENQVILEFKAGSDMAPIHTSQFITDLKLSNSKLGYLINFNVPLLKNGIQRIAN